MTEIVKINDTTYRIEDSMVRFFVLIGTEKAAVIDSGMNVPDAKDIAKSITDLPLIMINTHADRDHISGNDAFEEFYMSPDEAGNLGDDNLIRKIRPIHEGDIIDLGDRPLKIIDIPGHTPGSIAILDEKNRVLISGDTVQNGHIFMFGEKRNLNLYVESLIHLKEYDGTYDEIYPSHGSFPEKPELVDKLIDGANEILSGKAAGEEVDIFGNKVTLYKFPYAGFLYEK